MIIGKKVHLIRTKRIKYIMLVFLFIMLWQFSFPQPVKAQEVNINQVITTIFEEQWTIPTTSDIPRLPENPDKPQPEAKRSMKITVTAYSSTPDQTFGDPFTTASGTHVRDGVIAANFLPIGTKVRFPEKFGNKIFVVEDRMHYRYWYQADIWMTSREAAKQWGVQYTTIEIL